MAESMVRYCFAQGDLLRTRFAIAPLMELVGAVSVPPDAADYAVHRPWVEWAAPRIAALDVSLLEAAAPVTTHGLLARVRRASATRAARATSPMSSLA